MSASVSDLPEPGPVTACDPTVTDLVDTVVGAAELALLLHHAGRGDQEAFAALYDVTSARTFGLAHRILGDAAAAEDVLAQAYLEVWLSSGRLDATGGGPMAWILTIVHRGAVERVRAGHRGASRYPRAGARRAGPHTRPGVGRADSEGVRRVRRLLGMLSPRQGAALSLAYFSGHTHTEIDTLLGFGPGMAQVRIREGLQRLDQLPGQD